MTSESPSVAALTPLRFLERAARVYPDATAVVYGERRYSYAEFFARVNRLASALRAAGVQPGERVAVLCPNVPPLLEAHYGVPLAGAVLVAINTRLSAEEIAYLLNHSRSQVLIVDSELAELVAPVASQLESVRLFVNVIDATAGSPLSGTEYEDFLAGAPSTTVPIAVEDELDLISINYTSGTTGRPKGVMYTHRGAALSSLGQALELGLNPRSTYLWTLPMFHCNGWCFTWAVTAVAGTHICLRRIDPDLVARLVVDESVSHFCAAPVVLIALGANEAFAGLRLEHPLTIATGGAPPSPTLLAQMEGLGAELVHLYGLTETYGPQSICEPQREWDALDAAERARLKARQGVSTITAAEMRIVDDEMRDVPADGTTMGEVVMQGNNVMAGYFEDPDATAVAFAGGWFHSGDLGVMHPDGYIELMDRKKDIIISGGENISTIEVENTIYRHPAVLEVAVVAVPDERWGEVPKAFVSLKPGTSVGEDDIVAFCRDHLAHFKVPKQVEFGDLPKTATGKIQKFVLRDREWAGRSRRIN